MAVIFSLHAITIAILLFLKALLLMFEHFPSSSTGSIAFQSDCGRFTFSTDFNDNWLLTLPKRGSNRWTESRNCQSSLSEADVLVRFVIDHQNCSEGYDRLNGSNNPASIPCIVKTLEGVTDDYSHIWTEIDVRRYALLMKLFGKPAADSGW